jgi:hypothetical protein
MMMLLMMMKVMKIMMKIMRPGIVFVEIVIRSTKLSHGASTTLLHGALLIGFPARTLP